MLDLDNISKCVREVARMNHAQRAILFGSFARGTATPRSDVDIIFVEATSAPFLARLGRYLDPLSERLKTGIEVFVYTPEEFNRMKERSFVRRALKEGILLYES